MKLIIQQIKMPLDHQMTDLTYQIKKILKTLTMLDYKIIKKSVDARKKSEPHGIFIIYGVEVTIKEDSIPPYIKKTVDIVDASSSGYGWPTVTKNLPQRPIIVGSGPAGLFCALIMARLGQKPIILERGKAVEERHKDVVTFFKGGELIKNSNIQFGEGGAGTYSDGKINTGVKDKEGRRELVLDEFIKAGAPEEISYVNKPHIGTDYLMRVVKRMRETIIELGGAFRFESQVTSLIFDERNERIIGVKINHEEILESQHVVLAIGHSARDTFEYLVQTPVKMEAKSFAIGLRIEHPQSMIGRSQYGVAYTHKHLPVADYKLTYKAKNDRGVYSFCMCPGGFVVNASSEVGHLVCNGMSYFKRDSTNANSAIIATVHPGDFNGSDVLAGMRFQRQYEALAYALTKEQGVLPVQCLNDFMHNRVTKAFGEITPVVKGRTQFADLNKCLPPYVAEAIKEALPEFGKKIKGFDRGDALLTGVETRTSSPVRLLRDDNLESVSIKGLYPCGEGAGYAGGIMSAAIDGIKVAEAIVKTLI